MAQTKYKYRLGDELQMTGKITLSQPI